MEEEKRRLRGRERRNGQERKEVVAEEERGAKEVKGRRRNGKGIREEVGGWKGEKGRGRGWGKGTCYHKPFGRSMEGGNSPKHIGSQP